MRIAIDVGHALRTGAMGHGLEEHAECAELARILASKLELMGHDVEVIDFSKWSNKEDLNKTISRANEGGFDFGISLHCDASDNPKAKGAHVCYTSNKGLLLGSLIAFYLCDLLPGRANKTVKRTNLAILSKTKPVWVLAECGFITHAEDSRVIDKNKEAIADAIADGVRDYVDYLGD